MLFTEDCTQLSTWFIVMTRKSTELAPVSQLFSKIKPHFDPQTQKCGCIFETKFNPLNVLPFLLNAWGFSEWGKLSGHVFGLNDSFSTFLHNTLNLDKSPLRPEFFRTFSLTLKLGKKLRGSYTLVSICCSLAWISCIKIIHIDHIHNLPAYHQPP